MLCIDQSSDVTRQERSLRGQVALVTGSGRGLGRAIAERLAELGASVAVHDITTTAPAEFDEAPDLATVAGELARHGGKVVAVTGDIGDEAAVRRQAQLNSGAIRSRTYRQARSQTDVYGGRARPAAQRQATLLQHRVGAPAPDCYNA